MNQLKFGQASKLQLALQRLLPSRQPVKSNKLSIHQLPVPYNRLRLALPRLLPTEATTAAAVNQISQNLPPQESIPRKSIQLPVPYNRLRLALPRLIPSEATTASAVNQISQNSPTQAHTENLPTQAPTAATAHQTQQNLPSPAIHSVALDPAPVAAPPTVPPPGDYCRWLTRLVITSPAAFEQIVLKQPVHRVRLALPRLPPSKAPTAAAVNQIKPNFPPRAPTAANAHQTQQILPSGDLHSVALDPAPVAVITSPATSEQILQHAVHSEADGPVTGRNDEGITRR